MCGTYCMRFSIQWFYRGAAWRKDVTKSIERKTTFKKICGNQAISFNKTEAVVIRLHSRINLFLFRPRLFKVNNRNKFDSLNICVRWF